MKLQEGIQEYVLNKNFKNIKEAKSFYNSLKRKIHNNTMTTITIEMIDDNRINIMYFLNYVEANFREYLNFETDDPQKRNFIQNGLNDSGSNLEFSWGFISKSKEDFYDHLSIEDKHPWELLMNVKADAPEEAKTCVYWRFQPIEDHLWYKTIPFIIGPKAISPVEQWLNEADYFDREINDIKRFYLASHEALRISRNSINASISAGWASFRCERIKEAIDITKQAIDDNKFNRLQFVANINLGLFHYWKNDATEQVSEGDKYYDKAITILENIESLNQKELALTAINDIETYSDHLSESINIYSSKFRSISGLDE